MTLVKSLYTTKIIKPTQTGIYLNKYTFCIIKSPEPLQNLKTVPYLGLVLQFFG